MPNSLKTLLYGITILTVFNACSSTGGTSKKAVSSTPGVPTWYQSSGFNSDSLFFYGYAQAISSDSVIAVANAGLQANASLENALAEEFEDIRVDLEEEGQNILSEPEFLITLRNAHQKVQDEADRSNGYALSKDGHFLGYAEVRISKKELTNLMSTSFANKSSYKNAFLESEAFKNFVK